MPLTPFAAPAAEPQACTLDDDVPSKYDDKYAEVAAMIDTRVRDALGGAPGAECVFDESIHTIFSSDEALPAGLSGKVAPVG